MYTSPLFLLCALQPFFSTASARNNEDKILLSSVHSLTFHDQAMTSHRRVAAVPQLTCEGPACAYHTVSALRCTNAGAGYDAEDIQWTCTASLPAAFKLGATDVQCEGYASSKDKHVLRGSCGARYRLLFTEAGEVEYAEELARGSSWFGSNSKSKNKNQHAYPQGQTAEGSFGGKVFLVLFVAVGAWILYSAYMQSRGGGRRGGNRASTGPRRPGGGGGGGGGGGRPYGGGGGGFGGWNTGSDPSDEPPPPYTPSAGPRYTKTAPASSSSRASGAGQGWGNRGFWTGVLGGATAGYLAGSRRSGGGGRQEDTRRRGWGGGGGGGWGGGGGSSSSTAGSSSGSRSGEGRTYESTGFGGTSRR